MSVVTMKQFMQRAYEIVAKGWIQGALYSGWEDPGEEDGADENKALLPGNRGSIMSVCSVGAMRLTFAELVGVPIHREERETERYNSELEEYETTTYVYEWVDDEEITRHPFYQEGMKVLGKAFYQAEQLQPYIQKGAVDNPEKLLNGLDGRPYTVNDVSHSVIGVNDYSADDMDMLESAIRAAFRQAIELAPEDLTTEAFGDKVLEPTG